VIVVEPGAFRTGFNTAGAIGTSTPIKAYDDQIGPLREGFADADGNQPGDPDKAAAAIITALAQPEPPLHLPLGPDAVESIRASLTTQQDELDEWAELSSSTDANS
jgi:hypothetical protein